MKKSAILLTIFAALFAATGCKEKTIPTGPFGQGVVSERKVIIEEFTGVECQNCPQGSAEIANLRAIYGENLIAVSIHAGSFADPLPGESKYDFRTTEGSALEVFLGVPIAYPSAVVNRKEFKVGSGLQSFKPQWASSIQQELQVDPGLGIGIVPAFDAATRQLELDLTVLPTKNFSGEHRLTVMVTENHIIDAQIDGADHILDYEHEHVLRAVLTTPFDGSIISEPLLAGVPVKRHFSFQVPAAWKAADCHVVAFVHHGGNPDKVVLQAEEVPLQ